MKCWGDIVEKIIHAICIDLKEKFIEDAIQVKQGDTDSHTLILNITNEEKPFDLSGCIVRMYAEKPDNTVVFKDFSPVDASQGIFSMDLPSQLLAVEGIIQCEARIYGSTAVLASAIWKMQVHYSLQDDSAIESSNEYSALIIALDKAENANIYIDDCISAANQADTAAERANAAADKVMNITVNEKPPDSGGNILLSAEDIGTLPTDTIINNYAPSILDTVSGTFPVNITGIAENTQFKDMQIYGNTIESIASGTKSPLNKSIFQDIGQITTFTCGNKTTSISLPRPLFRINNDIFDTLSHTGALRINIKKLILKGTETWVHYKNNGNYVCFYLRDSNLKAKPLSGNGTGLCNIADWKSWITSSTVESGICTTSTNNIIFFNLLGADIGNDPTKTAQEQLNSFKSWLVAQYANGTPVIIYYQLEMPETSIINGFKLPIPDYPLTTLTTSDIVPARANIKYCHDTKDYIDTYISAKIAQLSAIK